MFEIYWAFLFPYYALFGVFVVLLVSAAFAKDRAAQRLRAAIVAAVVWTVLAIIEIVLPHAKN